MMKSFKRVTVGRSFAAAFALPALLLLAAAPARGQWTTNSAAATTSTGDAVGVGTASPANALTVRKDQAYNAAVGVPSMTQVQVRNDHGSGFASFSLWSGTERGRVQFNAGNPNLFLTSRGNIPLYLGTNDSIRMTLDGNTGHVGVGTTAPANALHVNSAFGPGYVRVSGAGLGAINFQDAGAPADQQLYQWRSEGGVFRMALSNDAGTALVRQNILVASPAGNVGVGTGAPESALHVSGASRPALTVSDSGVARLRLFKTNGGQSDLSHNASFDGTGWSLDNAAAGGSSLSLGDGFVAVNQWTAGAGYRAAGTPFYINSAGKVGIGTTSPQKALDVVGDLRATGDITGGTISATYQDVAEWVPSKQKLSAGTVVVLDTAETNHVVASGSAYDTKVAGVVSAEPGVILGVAGEGKVKVATTGRVRVRADASRGAIQVGDLLVTSDVGGVAMKSVPVDLGGVRLHRPGTIIGKALEPLAEGAGEILVLLSLQ
ncbi:MAG TPA: hypothetical protein VF508_11340 [Pyrinomonadaceae bacterium]|jgi:hypothetical protein